MNWKKLIIYLILFGILGYFRERFFEHLNIIMSSVYKNKDEYAILRTSMPWIMTPFSKMSYATLYYLKYPLTLLWTFAFFFLSSLTLKKFANGPDIHKILKYAYVLIVILAGFSMLGGYLLHNSLKNDEYTFSRWLFGIAQSPLICLILLAADKLNSNTKSYDP